MDNSGVEEQGHGQMGSGKLEELGNAGREEQGGGPEVEEAEVPGEQSTVEEQKGKGTGGTGQQQGKTLAGTEKRRNRDKSLWWEGDQKK